MDIRPLVVKEYLESLTESNELNHIFPILLESMGFNILSKPSEYKGLKEYGKDIVAVGKDINGVKTKFYFELKGGGDRNITESNFRGKDGIHDSLLEASYNEFVSNFPEYSSLPLKVIIVHNGVINGKIQGTFEKFLVKMNKLNEETSYDRWDIDRLTKLFSKYLFGSYLLTDKESTKLFNRVLINLEGTQGVSKDFEQLLVKIFSKHEWKPYNSQLPRRWKLLFESLKLVSFILYTESLEYNNLDIAKRYLTCLILKYWHWILKNNLETDKKVLKYFDKSLIFFHQVLSEYLDRNLVSAFNKDGLYHPHGGRYDQVGYTLRTHEFIHYFTYRLNVDMEQEGAEHGDEKLSDIYGKLLSLNTVSSRSLLDIHSNSITDSIDFLLKLGKDEMAKEHLSGAIAYLKLGKESRNCLPDTNNNPENVIKMILTGIKPFYYSDSTSPLTTVLLEYTAVLGMEEEYIILRDFIIENKIELGLFIPHSLINSNNLVEDMENDLEEQLFSKSLHDGYQSEVRVADYHGQILSFWEFSNKIEAKKKEFQYEYRTDKAGYSFLRSLAHHYFRTPYLPDKWRDRLSPSQDGDLA